jgi:DNA-binding NarL/FixJ family response regulator
VNIDREEQPRYEGERSHVRTVLVGRPGPLRDGLHALVATIPDVEVVGEASDASAMQRLVARFQPTLVLLDTDLFRDADWTVLGQIKAEWPETRCLALAETGEQHREAEAVDADAVLFKGFPAARFVETIVDLLPEGEA